MSLQAWGEAPGIGERAETSAESAIYTVLHHIKRASNSSTVGLKMRQPGSRMNPF
jgi:hypothetical protein